MRLPISCLRNLSCSMGFSSAKGFYFGGDSTRGSRSCFIGRLYPNQYQYKSVWNGQIIIYFRELRGRKNEDIGDLLFPEGEQTTILYPDISVLLQIKSKAPLSSRSLIYTRIRFIQHNRITMPSDRFFIATTLLFCLFLPSFPLTSTPYISPNPIYSDAGTFVFNTAPYFGSGTTTFNPLAFAVTFASRTHTSTSYSFGYSISHITYNINNNQVNYSLLATTKTATSVNIDFYTNNANKISNLAVSYIIIEPLFSNCGFYTTWINPNRNFWNGQNTQLSMTGVGPFSAGTQTNWTVIVGVDATLSGNNDIDLYAMAWLTSTTSIQFQISTIATNTFFLHCVIVQVFVLDYALLLSSPRIARFTIGERDANTGLSYSNSAMQSYNTIYGFRTYHTINQNFLNMQWSLSSSSLSVSSTNTFSWVAFDYLILEFITCSQATTPYLMLSNATCYDACPVRYYADEYKQCQACPYDCYYCYSNGNCSQCSSAIDFRIINNSTGRCVALDGYYDDNVSSQALPCNSSACKTCLTLTYCLSCNTKYYLSASNTCLSCIANCDNCTTSTDCQQCSASYTFQNGSCVVDCSNLTNCTSCSLATGVVCNTCVVGYNVTSNICAQLCGNGIRTQGEECDDGNANNLDGCSSTCMIEATYYCTDTGTANASLSSCSKCSSNCSNCSSSACTLCEPTFQLVSGSCTVAANTTNSTVTNATNTTATNSSANVTTTNTTTNATNSTNSSVPSPIVQSNCGNGVLDSGQQCDDANTNSNDGCSDQCQVQSYFTCSANAPSICNIQTLTPTLSSIQKNPKANQVTVNFLIQPSTVSAYQSLTWSNVVSQKSNLNIAMASTSFDATTGKLSISYSYTQNLNDNTLILGYTFPNNSPFALLNNVQTTTTLNEQASNLSLQVYEDSTYQTASLVQIIAVILSGVALLLFVLGFFKGKLIALQMITVFQLAYLSLLSLNRVSPTFYSLAGLSLSCGYTINLFHSKSITNRHNMLNLKLQFLDNYNTSLIFVVLPLLISLILTLVIKVKKIGEKQNISVLASRMRLEWVFYGLMFSLYIFFVSLGLSATQLQKMNTMEMIGLGTDVLLIFATILLAIKLVKKEQHMGQFVASFKQEKWVSSNYYVIIILERLLTSGVLLMAAFSMQAIAIMVLLIIQIILIIILEPYTIKGRRRRPLLNLSISLLIQLIYFFIPYLSSPTYQLYAPFAILGLLALTLVYNVYYLIKYIRSKKETKDNVENIDNVLVEQFKLLNSQRIKLDLNSTFLTDNQAILKPTKESNDPPQSLNTIREKLTKIKEVSQDRIIQRSNDIVNIESIDDFSAI